jgi:multiple antibiotic resistance protein
MRLLEFALFAFTSIFTVINPIGVLPVFLSMTQDMDAKTVRKVSMKASITAFLVMAIFAFTGQFIFNFFAISIHGLKIVGGILFFLMGYDMLQGKMSRTKKESQDADDDEFAITPLGIPMIGGPGTITVSVVLMQDNPEVERRLVLLGVMIIISLLTFLILIGSRQISRFLGRSGNRVMTRIMGLIVMMIAVEFFSSGLKPIVQNLLAK